MFVDFSHAGRDMLDGAIPFAPAHFVPLLMAVRDHAVNVTLVAQSARRFEVPAAGPAIVIIGDDLVTALGPPGFQVRCLRRLLKRTDIVAVMSGAPVASFYARMAREAVERRAIVVLIETQVSHEIEWSEFINEAAPDADAHLVSPTVAEWQ